MGFHWFKDINSIILAKLGCKLASGENSLWTCLLKAKYLKGKSFFEFRISQWNVSSLARDY